MQGDITAIINANGDIVVEYVYDSWGKLISITGTLADTVGVKNPYRYRGYRYDTELGMYYLQSRYYDPALKRFINADGFVSTGQGLLGFNMFTYCQNNPVNNRDSNGNFIENIIECVQKLWKKAVDITREASVALASNISSNVLIETEEITFFEYGFIASVSGGIGYRQPVEKGKNYFSYVTVNPIEEGLYESSVGYGYISNRGFGASGEFGLTNLYVCIHLNDVSYGIGVNSLARLYQQVSVSQDNGTYTFYRASINTPECAAVVGGIYVLCKAPDKIAAIFSSIMELYMQYSRNNSSLFQGA